MAAAAEQEETGGRRRRLPPEARKKLLREAARAVFADRGYAVSGLAEIAERADVNKRLLYYYYPDGRPELYAAVMSEVADELLDAVRSAVTAPLDVAHRTDRLVEVLVRFFTEQPDAFAMLFREPGGAREPLVVEEAAAIRSEVARELARLLAGTAARPALLDAVTTGAIGYVLEVVGLVVDGHADAATAAEACRTCVLGVLTELGS